MRERVGRASGKVILIGEHFAVHGGAAIAMPVPARSLTVRVSPGAGAIATAPLPLGEALARALRAMLDELASVPALGVEPTAIDLTLSGDLPIAAGLGGSAALAAALVRALGAAESEVQALVHRLEHLAHGRPSGVDGAVVSLGQGVWFEAGHITTLAVDRRWLTFPNWWIAVVPRQGSTHAAVAQVAARREADRDAFERAAQASREAALALRALLARAPDRAGLIAVGRIFDAAHARLAALGLSTPALESLVTAARGAGAYGAKLTGAGLGGALLVLAPAGSDLAPTLYSAGAIDVIGPDALEAAMPSTAEPGR